MEQEQVGAAVVDGLCEDGVAGRGSGSEHAQGLPVKGLGLQVLVLLADDAGEVVHGDGGVRVAGGERRLADLERLPVELLGLHVPALAGERTRKIVDGGSDGRVPGGERRAVDLEGLSVDGLLESLTLQ